MAITANCDLIVIFLPNVMKLWTLQIKQCGFTSLATGICPYIYFYFALG